METQNTAEEEKNPGDGGSEEDEEGGKNENEGAGIHCVSKFVPPPRPMCFIGGGAFYSAFTRSGFSTTAPTVIPQGNAGRGEC